MGGVCLASPAETELYLGRWTITEDLIQQYLNAVGDTSPLYGGAGLAPPLALAAYALGALLQKLSLPPGTVHSLQELETQRAVQFGEELSGIASVARPKLRGNKQFVTISYSLRDQAGLEVQTGKSTVLVIGAGASDLA